MKHVNPKRTAFAASCTLLAAFALTGCGCMQTPTPSATASPTPYPSPAASSTILDGMMPESSAMPHASALPDSGSMAGSVTTGESHADSGSAVR